MHYCLKSITWSPACVRACCNSVERHRDDHTLFGEIVELTTPTISLVIPTYNRAGLIAETLDRALAQVPPFLEIIVVDDGSTDHTAGVLAPYLDRITLISTPNGGVQRARNLGVAAARGAFIALCDSDDLLEPHFVDVAQSWLRSHPECNSIYSNFVTFDAHGVHDDKFSNAPAGFFDGAQRQGEFWYAVPDLYARSLIYQLLFSSGNILRRSLYLDLGGYDSQFNGVGGEDYEFTLRAVEAGAVALCERVLVRIRRHGTNDSTDNVRQVRGEIQILEYALKHHRSGAQYRTAILNSIERRRLDVFHGAFARGAFDIAAQMMGLLRFPPSDAKFRMKAFIIRLPTSLRQGLWRLTR
jgi:glycosyltransferase involved in cell wall biosynthesis